MVIGCINSKLRYTRPVTVLTTNGCKHEIHNHSESLDASRSVTKAVMLPTRGHFIGIDRNNRLFTFVFALFPGLLASGTSVTLVCAFLWALVSLATKRFRFEMSRTDKIVAWCLTFYVLRDRIFQSLFIPNAPRAGHSSSR